MVKSLPPEALRRATRFEGLPFESTRDLSAPEIPLGQEEALDAIDLAARMRRPDHHVVALGMPGLGRFAMIVDRLRKHAVRLPTPPDRLVVQRADRPERPRILSVPAGAGVDVADHVDVLLEHLHDTSRMAARIGAEESMKALEGARAAVKDARAWVLERVRESEAKSREALSSHFDWLEGRLHLLFADPDAPSASPFRPRGLEAFRVRALIDRSGLEGAPIVVERRPEHGRLFGALRVRSSGKGRELDHRFIEAGALTEAEGGYLVLDGEALLEVPDAFERLIETIRRGSVEIDRFHDLGDGELRPLPDPLPFDATLVLVLDRWSYYALYERYHELDAFFRVVADFEDLVPRTALNEERMACAIAARVAELDLPRFDREAVATLIEESARFCEDARRLSLDRRHLDALLLASTSEAAGASAIRGVHVDRAVEGRRRRIDRMARRGLDAIRDGAYRVQLRGERMGQVNGLSVETYAELELGMPLRITAQVRAGRGQVVDIEREVELSGPLHSKGVLILSGLLGGRYATDRPLSLHATLVLEQSYASIDGDSASLAELCALLSALSELPLRQSVAVTGAVDQFGQVQAVGGVIAKVEGFFDASMATGELDGHGVIIPESCVSNLVLRKDLVRAAEEGRFALWPVSHVDQAMELLTGYEAGERNRYGAFPPRSINGRVESRLRALAITELGHSDPSNAGI